MLCPRLQPYSSPAADAAAATPAAAAAHAGICCCHHCAVQVAPSYSNSHAIMNAAIKLTLSPSPSNGMPSTESDGSAAPAGSLWVLAATVVLGYPGPSGWVCQRAEQVQQALTGELSQKWSSAGEYIGCKCSCTALQECMGLCVCIECCSHAGGVCAVGECCVGSWHKGMEWPCRAVR